MKKKIQFSTISAILAITLSLASFCAEAADAVSQSVAAREKVVFQVSDSVPGKWNLALNNARNLQEALGKDNVDVEIVV